MLNEKENKDYRAGIVLKCVPNNTYVEKNYACWCVSACMCIGVCAQVHMYMEARGWGSDISLSYSPPYLLRHDLSLTLELAKLPSVTDQNSLEALGLLGEPLHPAVSGIPETELRPSCLLCLHCKPFIAPPPQPSNQMFLCKQRLPIHFLAAQT